MVLEDLAFGMNICPSVLEGMTVRRLYWWHERARAYLKRTAPRERR